MVNISLLWNYTTDATLAYVKYVCSSKHLVRMTLNHFVYIKDMPLYCGY